MGFALGKTHTQHASTQKARAVLCVGHFGSAVTILDERVVLWKPKWRWGFSCLSVSVEWWCVGRLLMGGEESVCVMQVSRGGRVGSGGVLLTHLDAMPDKTIHQLSLRPTCFVADSSICGLTI